MKAMKAMQEGLTAVRSEVKKIHGCTRPVSARILRVTTAHRQRLGEILEAVQATQNGPGREDMCLHVCAGVCLICAAHAGAV